MSGLGRLDRRSSLTFKKCAERSNESNGKRGRCAGNATTRSTASLSNLTNAAAHRTANARSAWTTNTRRLAFFL